MIALAFILQVKEGQCIVCGVDLGRSAVSVYLWF